MVKLMLPMLILTLFLSLLPPSSSAGPSLVFTTDSPGYARLEDIAVDEDLTFSLKFKTGTREAQLLYMRETTAGHQISLSLSDGGLHLQVHPDTSIGPLNEDSGEIVRLDDEDWHEVYITLNGGRFKFIAFKVDDTEIFKSVSQLPLLSNAVYQTWFGGIPPSLSEESQAPYVGCIRDIRVLDTDRDLQDLQLTGATVEECYSSSEHSSHPHCQSFCQDR